MKINELFKIQADMEARLSAMTDVQENVVGDHNILNVRILAIQVKLGELANLTKCYKYSKNVNAIPRNKVLFRYLEGMKYLLSLGNKYGLNMIDESTLTSDNSEDMIQIFSDLYSEISELRRNLSQDQFVNSLSAYSKVLIKYISLARVMDISYDEAMNYFTDLTISA